PTKEVLMPQGIATLISLSILALVVVVAAAVPPLAYSAVFTVDPPGGGQANLAAVRTADASTSRDKTQRRCGVRRPPGGETIKDLAITRALMRPQRPAADDTLHISLRITNLGNVEIVDAVISVFIEIGNTAYARPDQLLPKVSLAPGETICLSFDWALLPE